MINILLIGYGAIGSYVASQLSASGDTRIKWVLCRPGRDMHVTNALGPGIVTANALTEIGEKIDLAIECAGHSALAAYGPQILERGVDLITVSNGGLADDELMQKLLNAAQAGNSQMQVLPGAVGAIDALAAAGIGRLTRLTYRGRKPPSGWKGSHAEQIVDLEKIREPTRHFEGSARQAALLYPKNANVAATIALAGLGLDETQVELLVDPDISNNIHEIEAEGEFGQFSFRIEGKPLPGNPRSSALTAMSIVHAVRNRQARVIL